MATIQTCLTKNWADPVVHILLLKNSIIVIFLKRLKNNFCAHQFSAVMTCLIQKTFLTLPTERNVAKKIDDDDDDDY